MITYKISDYVRTECHKSTNLFGPAFFEQHILVVAEYGKKLAELLNADMEVVELSAYLHDISAILDSSTIPKHTVIGAEQAKQILNQYNYPLNRIQNVAQSILSHSAPIQIGDGLVEEICLSNADAISQIIKPIYWLYFAFVIRKLGYEEGRQWLYEKVEKNWNGLIQPAKELIEKNYFATKEFLISERLP